MDLMDEFNDDFPTVLGLSQSTQKEEPAQETSKIRMAAAWVRINREAVLRGLSGLALASEALARLLRPRLVGRLVALRALSRRLLRQRLVSPPGPAGGEQARRSSFFEIISIPAKTALTAMMYASYAALIYLAVLMNAVLVAARNICEEEEVIQRNRESENSRKAFSEPVFSQPMFPEGEIEAKPYRSLPEKPGTLYHPELPANKQSNKIQVLHSVFDQSAEVNEQM
ncbi:spermatogenesis-associated protein 9 isoform X1 [Cavia porcellus]|uniref:spermatogenesis-associated protein 9 isoform X1 n=2 Tax=Cavia porcellus TaxID=10141 RepID=UPI002FE29E03